MSFSVYITEVWMYIFYASELRKNKHSKLQMSNVMMTDDFSWTNANIVFRHVF